MLTAQPNGVQQVRAATTQTYTLWYFHCTQNKWVLVGTLRNGTESQIRGHLNDYSRRYPDYEFKAMRGTGAPSGTGTRCKKADSGPTVKRIDRAGADGWDVSYSRKHAPTVFELGGVYATYAQATQKVQELIKWSNSMTPGSDWKLAVITVEGADRVSKPQPPPSPPAPPTQPPKTDPKCGWYLYVSHPQNTGGKSASAGPYGTRQEAQAVWDNFGKGKGWTLLGGPTYTCSPSPPQPQPKTKYRIDIYVRTYLGCQKWQSATYPSLNEANQMKADMLRYGACRVDGPTPVN